MHKIARLSAFLMAACLCQAVAQDMCPQYLLDSAMTVNIEGRQDKDFFGRVHTPFKVGNNKVIVPDAAEVARNQRSRSAKLRIAERLAPEQ